MRLLSKAGVVRTLLLCAMPVALLAGAWLIGQVTIRHLLHHDAAMTGQGWATYLAENVKDLDRIAAGEKPTIESQRFFDRVQKVGQVFRYVIYDREGRIRLASAGGGDDDDDDAKDDQSRNLAAVRAVATRAPVVNAEDADDKEEHEKGRPPFFAEANVPVEVNGAAVAVVETYVDQTEKRDAYLQTLVLASAALMVLVGLAFGIPAIAWLRRSRAKRLADARIHFLARHDPLTGLINRDRLMTVVTDLLAERSGHPDALALHLIDIDDFKAINDTLGHDTGDALVQAVAERLLALAGGMDRVARIGGDEFVVVQSEWASEAGAIAFGMGLTSELARPFDINEHVVAVTVSVGVAVAPHHGDDVLRLMKSADLALYRSKAGGRNTMSMFSPGMDLELAERLRLERALRRATENDGFELHFQPAVEMPARRLVGFEALIRMHDQTGTLVSPAVFIPLAERMGLIDQIGTWVLREACRQAATWPPHLKVAVNLSPAQISTGHLAETVAGVLAETGLSAERLELEVTEGMLLDDSASVMNELRKLKALKVSIVMDDFGTGYSSLSYLWKFPFDKIKIDRAFMTALDMDSNDEASTIVKTIIDLGRSLNVTVTVEGVENARQVDFVSAAHCDQIQGFYFGRPIPSIELPAHIMQALQQQVSEEGSETAADATATAA